MKRDLPNPIPSPRPQHLLCLCLCGWDSSRNPPYVESHRICPSVFGSCLSAPCPWVHPHYSGCRTSFFKAVSYSTVCTDHVLFTHELVDEHLCCSVDSGAVNMGFKHLLDSPISILGRSTPRRAVARPYLKREHVFDSMGNIF